MSPERQISSACVELIRKTSSILGAVVHETMYVDCTVSVIRSDAEMAIAKLDKAERILKTCKTRPNRGKLSTVSNIVLSQLYIALGRLSAVLSELKFPYVPYRGPTTVNFLVNQSMVLLVKTIKMLQLHCLEDGHLGATRRSIEQSAELGDVVSRASVCMKAFVDASNTINILVECPAIEKETFLYSVATLMCMFKLLQNGNLVDKKGTVPIATSLFRVADTVEDLLYRVMDSVDGPDNEEQLAEVIARHSLLSFVQEVQYLQIPDVRSSFIYDGDTPLCHAILEGVSALGLIWNVCRKEGLESTVYAQDVFKARCCVQQALDLYCRTLESSKKRVRDEIRKRTYIAILSHIDDALTNLHMHDSCSLIANPKQFSDITQRVTKALNEAFQILAKRIIVQAKGTMKTTVPTKVDPLTEEIVAEQLQVYQMILEEAERTVTLCQESHSQQSGTSKTSSYISIVLNIICGVLKHIVGFIALVAEYCFAHFYGIFGTGRTSTREYFVENIEEATPVHTVTDIAVESCNIPNKQGAAL